MNVNIVSFGLSVITLIDIQNWIGEHSNKRKSISILGGSNSENETKRTKDGDLTKMIGTLIG